MEGSPADEEAAKDPAARQPASGVIGIHNIYFTTYGLPILLRNDLYLQSN